MIRAATLDDVDAILRLGEALHAESSYRSMPFVTEKVRGLMEALIGGAGVVFVSELAGIGVVGGIAGAVAAHWFNHELHGFDYSFFVVARYRSGTMALRLMCAFESWCRARGAVCVRLGISTGLDVEATARFYEWAGYKRIGPLLTKGL